MRRLRNNKFLTADIMRSWSEPDIETGCWNWLKSRANYGYGSITYLGKGYNAHRLMFMLSRPDESVEGKDVCHKCDNPACINPEHLFLAPHHENMRDMKIKGRNGYANNFKGKDHKRSRILEGKWIRGEDHRSAKLDADKVREIRSLLAAGHGYRILGQRFGVDRTSIRGIAKGRYWKDVK